MIETGKKYNIFVRMRLVHLNRKFRLGLIIFAAITFIAMVYLIYMAQKSPKYMQQKYPVYSYTHKAQISYEVALIQNPFYPQKSMDEGGVYIRNLIDHIDTLLDYEFDGERAGQIQGKYNAVAMLYCYIKGDSGDKVIWQKEYSLQPDTSFNSNSNQVLLQKKLSLNVNNYNNIIKQMQQTAGFDFNSKLIVTWNIHVEAQTDKGVVNEELSPTMEIPMDSSYFEVSGNMSPNKKGAIQNTRPVISPDYLKREIAYWTALGFCAVLLLFLTLFTAPTAVDEDEVKIRKIFKIHGDRMSAVEGEIEAVSEKVVKVVSIDDLVKIADDIGKPVLFVNKPQVKEISNFYVIDEKIIYSLSLRT